VNIMVAEHGLSVRQACRAARLARSAYYAPARPRDERAVVAAIETYIAENQQHGFDKLYPVVRARLWQVPAVSRLQSAEAQYQATRQEASASADQGTAVRADSPE